MKIYFFVFIFFSCLIANNLNSQGDLLLKEIPNQFKLKEDYVRKFYNDSFGLIWMRTFCRVLRYDGSNFQDFDKLITPDFGLKDLYMLGNKFILNYDNAKLKVFDIKRLKLSDIKLPNAIKGISHISVLNENNIFISCERMKTIFSCKLIGDSMIIKDQIMGYIVANFIAINDSILIISLPIKNSIEFQYAFLNWNRNFIKPILQATEIEDFSLHDSIIYLLFQPNLCVINFKALKVLYEVKCPVYEDGHNLSYLQNKLWLFTDSRIYLLNDSSKTLDKVNIYTSDLIFDSIKQFFAIHYQKEGDYYLISNLDGIFKLIPKQSIRINFYDFSNHNSIRSNINLRCIYFNDNAKEVYTSINLQDVTSYKVNNGNLIQTNIFPKFEHTNLQEFNLNKIRVDSANSIWLCGNTGIKIITGNNVKSLKLLKVWDICFSNRRIWVVSNSQNGIDASLCSIDRYGRVLKSFNCNLYKDLFFASIEPFKNFLLISSSRGLLAFDTLSEKFIEFNKVTHISEDLSGRAWSCKVLSNYIYIAFQDKGLKRIELATGNVTNPISSLTKVFQIESYQNQDLWINCQDKLIYLDRNQKYFILKTNNYALPSTISFHGIFINGSGDLYVCGKGGFSVLHTQEIVKSIFNLKSNNIICNLTVNERLIKGNVPDHSTLTFPHDSNSISLTIANDLLDNQEDIKLRYKLNGYDKKFSEVENTNNITYKNLPYGDYTLDIYLCNSYGIWNENPTQLFINILPPWYLSKPAKTLYVLLVLGALYFTYVIIKQSFEKQKKQEFMLIESELKAIRSQLNPHFIFNSLNSIQNHIIRNRTDTAVYYLNKFAKLLRRALDFSTLETISLQQEIDWVSDYLDLEGVRFVNKFEWEIICDPSINKEIQIPALVIQPLIENAIIHGLFPKKTSGKLLIHYSQSTDRKSIECIVQDDGVGRKNKDTKHNPFVQNHISKGLLLTQQRLEYLGKQYKTTIELSYEDLYDSAGEPSGTKVIVRFPIVDQVDSEILNY